MDGEVERTCPSCGKQVKEGADFCTNCGAAVTAAGEAAAAGTGPAGEATQPLPPTEAAAAPPPGPPVAPPPVPPAGGIVAAAAPVPGVAPEGDRKKNKAALFVGIIGGILVVAGIVVLVLWLAVWKDGGGGGGSANPQALAQKYMDSLAAGDIDAYMDCFEEDFFINEMQNNPFMKELGLTEDDIKEYAKMAFEMMEVRFEGVKLKVESETGDQATVVTTAGTSKISVLGMEEELDLAADPLEFNMVKKGGRWYLTENPMGATMGTDTGTQDLNLEDFDLEDLNLEDLNLQDLIPEDLNLEDLEQWLPEGMNLEDLENMTPQELEQLLKDLEQLMQELPQESSTGTSTTVGV